jgi:signal transduction histidine kinase
MKNDKPFILIVEDSPTQAAELAEVLGGAGFETRIAPDGETALTVLRNDHTVDLVLSDIIMPGLWGHELCRQIKSRRDFRDLPVILLTSLNEPSDIIHGLECGADNYVIKPFEPASLLRRIEGVLERPRSRWRRTASPISIEFMGREFAVRTDRARMLSYLCSAFEDFAEAKRKEHESREAEALQKEEAAMAAALARARHELIGALDASELPSRLSKLTRETLACDASCTFLWDATKQAYVPAASDGETPEEWQSTRQLTIQRSSLADLLDRLERESVVVTEPGAPAHSSHAPLCFNLYFALREDGEVVGFQVAAYRQEPSPWTARQRRLAQGLSQTASLALENCRLVGKLRSADQLKSEFLNTMSHELRTPLHAILGYTQLLLEGTFGALEDEQIDTLRCVEERARDLTDLVDAILNLSHLEGGNISVSVNEVSPAALIREIDADFRRRVPKPGVTLAYDTDVGLPKLFTDGAKLKVVLRNLIDNALKFTESGSVIVSTRGYGDGIEFTVADTGIGIRPEQLPIIFDSFRQGDGSMTRRHGGVGLGLYVAKRLTALLGGTLDVESEVGQGTLVRLWVPLKLTQGPFVADCPAPRTGSGYTSIAECQLPIANWKNVFSADCRLPVANFA